MSKPTIASRKPVMAELEAGKTYYYCTCGKSANQPFCDGAHAGSEFSPLAYTSEETKKAALCACKHTKNGPFCDGSHRSLPEE
ncbi:MAG: CDGSH iron-sulfur domain-containing protein [Fibrobacterales bacterium]